MQNGRSAERPESSERVDQMEVLVESSLPLIFSTYDQARHDLVRDPVILLIDCDDAMGREIVEAWLGPEMVDDAILAIEAERDDDGALDDGHTTVFARPMPLAVCRREIPPVFPYLNGGFDSLPPHAVLVMAVSNGGAATFVVPFSSRPGDA
jgi:hypothetical protein